ncbi:MAG: tetratricopeptide repeat protein [Bacteroidaceae bacterium]|nr:tetratricopeptide repeat protein [Bacteroidaceae bacterium]
MNYEKGYFDTPEFRELLKRYEHAKAMNMHSYYAIDELVDLLSYYLYVEKHDEAEQILKIAGQIHPAAPENTKMEIKLMLSKGEAKRALELFAGIQYIDDNETKILHAEILLALKDFKNAREIALDIIRTTTPEQENLYEALEILLDCGFALDALYICEKALKLAPANRSLLEVKAECFIEMQRINEAIDLYNSLLDADPYSTFYWEQLGHIYYMVKRYGKALECFEYESTINDEIEYARMMQAYCYYHVGDYARTKEMFGLFKERYPQSVIPRFYIALSQYHEGDPQSAVESFKEIIDIAPEGTIEMMLARVNKAMILDSIGEGTRAEEAISMAIMMHPDNMKQLILRGTHLYELRDKENLIFSDMNALEQKEWTQEEELYELGVHLFEHGHPNLALRIFRYMRPFSHDASDVDAYIANILWQNGEREKVEPSIENAINGRSCILFRLFGITYDAGITPQEFIARIR